MPLTTQQSHYSATVVEPTFTVSVTGHRRIHNAHNLPALTALVCNFLSRVQQSCLAVAPGTELRLVSALAIGADQIAAGAVTSDTEMGRMSAWQLHVILPFEKASYRHSLYDGIASDASCPQGADLFDSLLKRSHQVYELADRKANPGRDEKGYGHYWRDERFHTLGEMLARQSDLLLAIWDGTPGKCRGGTADVVRTALRQGKPVLCIDPDFQSLSYLQVRGDITDPMALATRPLIGPSDNLEDFFSPNSAVEKLIHSVLAFPEEHTGTQSMPSGNGSTPEAMLTTASAFFGIQERLECKQPSRTDDQISNIHPIVPAWLLRYPWTRRWLAGSAFPQTARSTTRWRIYQALEQLFITPEIPTVDVAATRQPSIRQSSDKQPANESGSGLRVDYARTDWEQVPNPESIKTNEHLNDVAMTRAPHLQDADDSIRLPVVCTDAIATSLGHAYRSSYVITFLGGALAVWIGLAGLFSSEHKFVFVLLELSILIVLIGFYNFVKTRAWHRRWLNARHIAESMRANRFLIWLGFGGRRAITDDAPWTAWYTNAVMAGSKLPNTTLRVTDIRYMACELREHVGIQSHYHEKTAKKLKQLHHRLDMAGRVCLLLAIGIAFLYVAVVDPWHCFSDSLCEGDRLMNIKYAVTVLCAGLPALAGAFMGIRFQGDFERFSERSEETHGQLDQIDRRLMRLVERSDSPEEQPLFEELSSIVIDLIDIFENDLEDWRYVYSARPSPDVG